MRDTTLCFLIKEKNDQITDICLAMKKRGFGQGRWNGVGGKVKDGETIEAAVAREAREEIGVAPSQLGKIAEIEFVFPADHANDQFMHTYLARAWDGTPRASEEMRPQWYPVSQIPYQSMWPDDIFWVPKVLAGKLIEARFDFGPGDTILKKTIEEVDSF